MITFGAYENSKIIGTICAFGVILGPLYLLNLYQDTMLGEITVTENQALKDINLVEMLPFVLLGALIFLYGLYPRSLTSIYEGLIN